jgi:hypothetical protein
MVGNLKEYLGHVNKEQILGRWRQFSQTLLAVSGTRKQDVKEAAYHNAIPSRHRGIERR